MKSRFQFILGAVLAVLYLLFLAWHSPWEDKLTRAEIDQYMAAIERLPLPADEVQALTSRLRPWAEADDGKPIYTFNLIRFFPQLQTFPGAPAFNGTPEDANALYEASLSTLWLSNACYPTFIGNSQARNLMDIAPERTWDNATVVRCPSRRTFLRLLSDPVYASVAPYKLMAMRLDLAPFSGDMVIPDPRWVVGGSFIIVFLLVGWVRAARRSTRHTGQPK